MEAVCLFVSCLAVSDPDSERTRAICEPDNSNVQCFVREERGTIVSVAVPHFVLLLDTLLMAFYIV